MGAGAGGLLGAEAGALDEVAEGRAAGVGADGAAGNAARVPAGADGAVDGVRAGVAAGLTGAAAEVRAEATGDVADVAADDGKVAACACRENTNKTAKIPAARIATCTARRAM
jgi:hypothetical protein